MSNLPEAYKSYPYAEDCMYFPYERYIFCHDYVIARCRSEGISDHQTKEIASEVALEFNVRRDGFFFGVKTAHKQLKLLDRICQQRLDRENFTRIPALTNNSQDTADTPHKILDILCLCLPKRLAEEDVGDALEVIYHLRATNASTWKIYLKTASTVFWVSLNAFREFTSAFLGKAGAAGKR